MIKGYQAELMDMYEKTRTEENRKLAKRREEIKNKYRADVIAVAHHQVNVVVLFCGQLFAKDA